MDEVEGKYNSVIEFVEYIWSHKDNLSLAILFLSIGVALIICLANYKDKLWEYLKNRRNAVYIAFIILYAALLFFFKDHGLITGNALLIYVILWILYTISVIISIKPKINNYTHPFLRYYSKRIEAGEILKHIKFFEKENHWYFLDGDIKIEYKRLQATFFSSVKDYEKAYKALASIDNRDLYSEEKKYFDKLKAFFLTQMGDMTAACELLGSPDNNDSKDPYVWISYSYIHEQAGDIDKALEYARKAKDLADLSTLSVNDKAQVYNDYARAALFSGNREEALQYFRTAYKKAEDVKDIRVYEVLVSNLIFNMARAGESKSSCEKFLKKYKKRIKTESIDNMVEYNNCAITYYRQIKDEQRVYQLIKSGYKDIVGKLNHSQKEIYKACTFRMIMNGHYRHDWFDKEVVADIDNYLDLAVMDRLIIFKEYMGVLQQNDFRALLKLEPYKSLYANIMQYYEHQAIDEINECLAEVESFNVYKYKELIMHKLGILKLIQKEKHIELSKHEYLSLVDKLFADGLRVEATYVLTILIDECGSPYNLLAILPWWPRPMYYYEFANKIEMPPDPYVLPDKIHMNYYVLTPHPLMQILPTQVQTIEENIDKVIAEFDSWKDHPAKIEMSIQIAHTLHCLGRSEEAKRFLKYFKESGVSELAFTSWFNNEVHALEAELAEV